MSGAKGSWPGKRGKKTKFPPITDRDPELKTEFSKPKNPGKEEDSPMSTPVG